MGAFLVNFHVRNNSLKRVSEALRQIPIDDAWIVGPQDDWVSFWEKQASEQNADRIQYIAEHVSQSLAALVIAFLVHDSDVLCYWLYDSGKQLDEYNSCPGYWGDDAIDEKALASDCKLLAKYCRPGTEPHQIENILAQWTHADMAAGVMPAFTFAEERLAQLAALLGVHEDLAMTDYNDIGGEVRPKELGASWIGSGEQPDVNSSTDDETDLHPPMPPGPLHAAAARDDIVAIERLIADGAEVNDIPHGYTVTALGLAASQATAATIRKLVALGADLHKKGREGATPLRLAVQSGQVEKIRTLVQLGADIDEYDARIGTLMHVAVMMQASPEVIRLLLEVGVDSERENAAGFTPLHGVQAQLAGLRQVQVMLEGAAVPTMADQINSLELIEPILQNPSR